MGAHDWYKNTVWTQEAEETFNAKIKGARDHKPSYFTTQVNCLISAGDHDNAETLARRALVEVDGGSPQFLLTIHKAIGAAQFLRGDLDEAEFSFSAAADAHPLDERTLPMRGPSCRMQPETCLERLRNRRRHVAGEELHFDWVTEKNVWPWLELRPWKCVDLSGDAITEPEDAAELLAVFHHINDHLDAPGAMDAVFAASPEGLAIIDELVASRAVPGLRLWHVHWYEYLGWLGGYIGRVLVNNVGGVWQPTEHLTDSTVQTDNGTIDPFLVAWRAINLGEPLVTVLPDNARV